jgi:hypothetical protein
MNNYESKQEIALYPSMLKWLQMYLGNKHPKAVIKTYDVHSVDLSDFIQRNKYTKFFPEYATYKIRVDLLGIILENDKCNLVFVEVKDTSLSLINLSQLLGYCKILRPEFAFLISPKGLAKPLSQLLVHFNRLDILEFDKNKFVRVAKWNPARNAIEIDSIIPPLGNL